MKIKLLSPSVTLVEVFASDEDWEKQSPQVLLWMLQQMILIRRFEETLLDLNGKNLINGPVHTSIGQEAIAVGVSAALAKNDKIAGTHRAHHQYLAKVLDTHVPQGFNPLEDDFTPEMDEAVRVLLAEIIGLAGGCSGGRGGSMHLFNKDAGVVGTNAIVGGGVPSATGSAWADRFQGREDMTVCFFGDGALYQGVLSESSNLASLWKVPIVYFIENNQYSVGTALSQSCSAKRLCDVAAAYGMNGVHVDGMNPLAVKLCIEEIKRHRENGWLPSYVQADTYRYFHHAGGFPGSAYKYRGKDEEKTWRDRDPIEYCRRQLTRLGHLDEEAERALREKADACLAAAVAHSTQKGTNGKPVVHEVLWPEVETLADGLRAPTHLQEGERYVEAEDVQCTRQIKYSDAIAEVTGRWLEREPGAFVLGEEVANMGGGAYGATKKLIERFPNRVLNTPVSEAGFCGLACGAALNGMFPIVELMFSSFVLVAADQLLNQIGQIGHIYGGHTQVPLVVRTRVSIGLGYGAQHSLDPAALFNLFPGWRIFAPTTPFDYVGLFNAAMRSKSPTLIIEHHGYYDRNDPIPEGPPDHFVEPGKAKVVRTGSDVTVAAHSWMVQVACEAADVLADDGVGVEVIDLRTLDNAGMDYETLGGSLMKTGRLVVAEQAPASNTVGAKIAVGCQQRFGDCLKGIPRFVAAPDVPIPVSRRLEEACLPGFEQVADAIKTTLEK